MKWIAAAAILIGLLPYAFAGDCSTRGDATNQSASALNILKNRSTVPAVISAVTIEKMLTHGDDTNRFDSQTAAAITGYVVSVIPGGIESCNCHARDNAHRDTHIYVAADARHSNIQQCIIVEVTPRSRGLARGEDWSTAALKKKLVAHTVTFSGWLLFDAEHKQNAINTNPGNKGDWRATAWEIHPVMGIKVAPSN